MSLSKTVFLVIIVLLTGSLFKPVGLGGNFNCEQYRNNLLTDFHKTWEAKQHTVCERNLMSAFVARWGLWIA